MILLLLTILLFSFYGLLMIYYWIGWRSFRDYHQNNGEGNTTISVIIPARNEEENIERLLISLQEQRYPPQLFEVIVVDDHSTDQTASIVQTFPGVRLVQLKGEDLNSYKKKAIEAGIAAAQNSLIVTTDADCIAPPGWLRTIASFKKDYVAVFIAAPVSYSTPGKNLLTQFQALDFLVLQGVGAVSVERRLFPMCNGANLAYDKKIFYEVDGFKTIDAIASGDDMLLMQKISKNFPLQVHYLKSKEAIVTTQAVNSLRDFLNQRLRWASKARYYNNTNIFSIQLLVYLFNLLFLVLATASFWDVSYFLWLAGLWIAKTAVELPFTYSVASWFNQRSLLKWFFIFQPFHIVYIIVVGLLAQFIKYEWKGRQVR